ncbi:MAG TPA: 2-C-methyl-D-erythritol 4-phosphate cytidylyltransferase [Cellvibrionaceae bacterium]|nr:2-C-methyl-D-erythritol 4-phosphate cytidylyltransferase [Cellvibrionaceae bacterium]HMW73176.1 2-C-methyl-D-erythritol 4-phosphate cytidylyltransferase [Cellvibrionaceae bacterium]HNG60178.1 2-C-methyl-D-erythritol 4-phosphate cytidylyltransferase [Cellvibrionaceae bacterium]
MTDTPPRLWALIPAAGTGSRMQAASPKQYLPLAGKTLLEVTLGKFLSRRDLAGLLLVSAADDSRAAALELPLLRCSGGASRADSVLAGIEFLLTQGAEGQDYVLVHDAARPCVTTERIDALIQTVLAQGRGGLLACPVSDTLKQSDGEQLPATSCTLDRTQIWQAHTPQMFRLGELKAALQQAKILGQAVTDEASALELTGVKPLLVADRRDNIKVTLPEDLALAEFILQRHEEQGL